MSDKFRIHAAFAIKRLLKGKDHKHLADALPYPADAELLPGPELRADKVNDGDAQLFAYTRQTKIHIGKIDQHGDIRLAGADAAHETSILGINARHVTYHFRDTHYGDVFRAHDALTASGFHCL